MSELELHGEIDEALRRGVAVVWTSSVEPSPLGTAFFIGNDGSLLTCLHILKSDKDSATVEEVRKSRYLIQFGGRNYVAECIFIPLEPRRLDIAVLRLEIGKLPDGGELLPLGQWTESAAVEGNNYVTLGYRSPGGLLRSKGIIEGRVLDSGLPYLQLSSEAKGEQGSRRGMSGAPVLHHSSRKVVGLVVRRYQTPKHGDGDERVPFAVPIDAVADVWQPVQERLKLAELYDTLTWILSTDGFFSNLLFQELLDELPAGFYFSASENKPVTPKRLVGHLAERKQLNAFVQWLLQSRSSIGRLKYYLKFDPFYDKFANRKKELKELEGPAQYILLDAPPGYGKTSLLKKLESDFMVDQWLSYYVEVPYSSPNCKGIAVALQEKFGRAGVAALTTVNEMGKQIGKDLLHLKSNVYSNHAGVQGKKVDDSGVILLIDNLERIPDDEELRCFFDEFLPAIYNELSERPLRLPLRVRVAGRRGTAGRLGQPSPINVLTLDPFDYDSVVETVNSKFPEGDDTRNPEASLRAAHLWNLTGGHPGSMAEILQQPDIASPPDYIFLQNREKRLEFEQIVLKATDKVRESIPEDLQVVFDSLSFFRKFTFRIISQAIDKGLLEWPKAQVKRLADRLTQTYLIRREPGFLEDEIVRRLLVIRMRLKQPEEFLRGYEIARDIYREILAAFYYPVEVVLETLFVELQLRYYTLDPQNMTLKGRDKPIERKDLCNEFFAEDGILNQYLSQLQRLSQLQKSQDMDDYPDLLDSLKAAAIKDKEFAFTLNYFLRDEYYSNAPFIKFQSIIESKSRK